MEKLIIVDKNDNPIGTEGKMKTHENALLHRAFSVFVFRKKNNETELLIQQREKHKYHCGGLWTNTACGHPHQGEEIISLAAQRLKEEMGFLAELQEAGKFHYIVKFKNGLTENEIDHVFVGFYHDEKIIPNPTEIENYRWISIEDLKKDLQERANQYTPWLKRALKIAEKLIRPS